MSPRIVQGPSLPGYGFWTCPECWIASCPGCEPEPDEADADVCEHGVGFDQICLDCVVDEDTA